MATLLLRGSQAPLRPRVARMRSFEDGGDANIDPNDPTAYGQPRLTFNSSPAPGPAPTPGPTPPVITSPYATDPRALQLQNRGNYLNSQLAQIGPSQDYLNALGGVYQAQANTIPYRQGVITAQQGTFGPQRNYIDAEGRVIDAQGAYTQGQRGLIGQQQQDNAQSLQEEQTLQAAEANLPDLTATAAAQNEQNNTDYQYGLAGMHTPVEVDTQGKPLPAGSPPGVRAKIQSQAEIVAGQNKRAQALRTLQLQGAKLAVDLLGTDVDAARQAAARVGLTVDQAQLLVKEAENALAQAGIPVEQAQNAADFARLAVSQSELNTRRLGIQNDISELPPAPGLEVYTNPFTGQSSYLTPAQAEIQRAWDQKQIAPSLPSGASGVTTGSGGLETLSLGQLETSVSKGVVSADDAIQALVAKGYTPANAKIVVSGWQKSAASKAQGDLGVFTPAQIRGFLSDGKITYASAEAALIAKGWTSQQIALYLGLPPGVQTGSLEQHLSGATSSGSSSGGGGGGSSIGAGVFTP